MRQQTLAEASFEPYRKATRRERFMAEMEQVIPWRELCYFHDDMRNASLVACCQNELIRHSLGD